MMVEIGEIGLPHVDGRTGWHLQLDEVGRVRQRHGWTVHKEPIGRLSVDDQTIRNSILTNSEYPVHCCRCSCERDHPSFDETTDQMYVFGPTASDTRGAERARNIQLPHSERRTEQSRGSSCSIRGCDRHR